MKVIDIRKGKSTYQKMLAKLEKSLKLNDLFETMQLCIECGNTNCVELLELWANKKEKFKLTINIDKLFDVLLTVKVLPQKSSEIIDKEYDTERAKDISEIIKVIDGPYNKRDARKDEYSWFFPSSQIADALEQMYPEELNPGRVIAKHLQVLFPDSHPDDYAELVSEYSSDFKLSVPFESPLRQLLVDVVLWAIEHSMLNEKMHSCYRECLKDLNFLERHEGEQREIPLSEIFMLLPWLPRELFYKWIHDWFLAVDHFDLQPLLSLADLKAALLFLPIGRGNKPLIFSEPYQNMMLNNGFPLESNDFDTNKSKHLSFDTFIWILDSFRYVEFDDQSYNLVHNIVSNFTEYRQNYLSGITPIDISSLEVSNTIDFILCQEDNDLLLLLSTASLDSSDLNLLPMGDDLNYPKLTDFYNQQQETYLLLCNKAHAEELYELGTALLSLYIFYRAFVLKGRFGNLSELIKAIENALRLPGAKMLRHTLAFVVESIDEYFAADPVARSSALYFRQFIPQGAELKVLQGGRRRDGGQGLRDDEVVRAFLQRQLGADRWEKLSPNSRECLVSAEMQWDHCYVQFGWGIKDWSGFITPYCKPIEGEILSRLGAFYHSEAYETYYRERGQKLPAKPTAGWLLKELKSFATMPEPVQDAMRQTGSRLHEDMGLVNALCDIVQNYRNVAAHSDAVSMKRYTDFRKKLFQDGILHRFIDAVC